LTDLLERAFSSYRDGRLAEAAKLCRALAAAQPDFIPAWHLLADVQSSQGRYDEALSNYDRALAIQSENPIVLNNRGNTLQILARFEEALASYDKALAIRPDLAIALNSRGNTLAALLRWDEALASYDKAQAIRPDYTEALNNRGNTLQELGRLDEALASYDKALATQPDNAIALNNRGNVLHKLRRFEEALATCDRALTIRPDDSEALNTRANSLQELERFEEALATYDKALAIQPDNAISLNNRGNTLEALTRFEEALASYDKALAIRPDLAMVLNNRGNVLATLTRFDEALAAYDRVLTTQPNNAIALTNRGNVLQKLNRFEEALASYDRALSISADNAEAFCNRALSLYELGRFDESRASYRQSLALKPDFVGARFGLCMTELPILYADAPQVAARRAAYERSLRALCDSDIQDDDRADVSRWVGLPFYLAYQGYNDRDLQALHGSLVCRLMARRYPPTPPAPQPAASEPVRVGFVSGHFRLHSNWKLPIKGWLSQLDRRKFRLFGYYTGDVQDAETKAASGMCDRFVQGPLSIERWREEILADAPHVLIYPEVAMDRTVFVLAAQRLAAVQCNSWGHPDTSGFPTLDYYVSSDLMEPADGQNHYTEELVRLPNLSVYCEPFDPPSTSLARRDFGMRPGATIYWSGQSLFKYLPQFDEVFPRIARAAGDCQFAFIQYHKNMAITDLFRQRLDRAFAAFGLRADEHCVFLPPLVHDDFLAAMGQCDIFLDSIGWSGCNSTLESLTYDLPIVTIAGPLMRGRHSMAILQMMDVTQTIAETVDDYVSIAVRLAKDAPWRAAVKADIAARKHRIYRDGACISGLERFLDRVGRQAAAD
jgi:predicted O-linked N-acetylglucosamine transferase (SPINDLY family)